MASYLTFPKMKKTVQADVPSLRKSSKERVWIRNTGALQAQDAASTRGNGPNVWYLFSNDNPAARWIMLTEFVWSFRDGQRLILRGRDTCLECAFQKLRPTPSNHTVVLL